MGRGVMALAGALIWSETLKLRHTLAAWVTVIGPTLALALTLISLCVEDFPDRHVSWGQLLENSVALWFAFLMPTQIALQTASTINLEHNGNQWKQIFALPVPRWSVYATKLLVGTMLAGLSLVLFSVGLLVATGVVISMRGLQPISHLPWLGFSKIIGEAFMACWLLVAIQTWLSVRFAGFLAPAGIGFGALIVGLLFMGMPHAEVIAYWYPWTLAFSVVHHFHSDTALSGDILSALMGSCGGLLFGIWACRDLTQRETP